MSQSALTPSSPHSDGSSQNVPRTPSSVLGTPARRRDLGSQSRLSSSQQQHQHGTSSAQHTPSSHGSRRGPDSSDPHSEGDSDMVDGGQQEAGTIWGTNVKTDKCTHDFAQFIDNFRNAGGDKPYLKILDELLHIPEAFIELNAANLAEYDRELYANMIAFPADVINLFDKYIHFRLKRKIHERVTQVRPYGLMESRNMRELNPEDVETLVAIKGMVIRCGSVIPELSSGFFMCINCHNYKDDVENDGGRIEEPVQCPVCKTKHSMQLIHNRSRFADKQLIKIQETPDSIPDGETPHTISVFAYDDLVDFVRPGDRVEITGIFRAQAVRLNPRKRTVRTVQRTYLDAIHFRKIDLRSQSVAEGDSAVESGSTDTGATASMESNVTAEARQNQEAELLELSKKPNIYDRLVASFAPSIYEMDDVKRGVLCMLFGGTTSDGHGSGRFRGELNVLLCGDPGTSKSQMLQYVHKLAPRGIFTSGKGSSAVGLSAYISRDPVTRELVLESGALVLSDRGVCCIDEFDKMSESTRSILHEVMEQQTVSIAKAGIVCSLNARASIFASANPKQSRYNPKMSVVRNIDLGPTLLSRFDLIYLILDQPNREADKRLASHLVGMYFSVPERNDRLERKAISIETLKQYIAYARKHIHPRIDNAAAIALDVAYRSARSSGRMESKKIITATPRQLESLIRLSEALARMKFRAKVTKEDVDEAARLMAVATQTAATDPTTGKIDMNILTTGRSAEDSLNAEAVRAVADALVQETKTTSKGPRHARPGITVGALREAFNARKSGHGPRMDHEKFLDFLHEVGASVGIHVHEDRRTITLASD